MAESTTPTSQTETSPPTGPSSFGSAIDAQGLPTVHEVPHHHVDHDFYNSMDHRLLSISRPSVDSGNASPLSSMGRSFDEKPLEQVPHRLRHTTPSHRVREARQSSDLHSEPPSNGIYFEEGLDPFAKATSPKKLVKEKKGGGLRHTLRRMFGRRSVKDRISMPAPTVYPRHDPEEFITSATNIKTKRSASVPTNGLLRTSGLSSHPPFQILSVPTSDLRIPPQPERCPPERPLRQRRASLPSVILNREEMQVAEAAMAGLLLQDVQEQNADARNIGFAVTNGSNPKRRSRSVGALPGADHRMSPIQWHHWRRRSDELRHWRESANSGALGIKALDSPVVSPNLVRGEEDEIAPEPELGEHNEDFNFGLPADAMEMQNQERMGLEERLITLEIKLMDFEYAVSRLQAGPSPASKQHSRFEPAKRQESVDSYLSIDPPQASTEPSSSLPHGSSPMISQKISAESTTIQPKPRPTSVATTLRPTPRGLYESSHKGSVDNSIRTSLTGLTIEHYTTLITLIRHEQSSRVRLEQQVLQLQNQIERLSPRHQNHSHHHTGSQHSYTYSQSSQQGRRGMTDNGNRGGGIYRQHRPRSSSFHADETDTDDDDNYHDVYVTPDITPLERGEYERGLFERVGSRAEGVAF